MPILNRNKLEIFKSRTRSNADRRKFVSWAVFSYIEEGTNFEYRKSFESTPGINEYKFWDIAPKQIIQK